MQIPSPPPFLFPPPLVSLPSFFPSLLSMETAQGDPAPTHAVSLLLNRRGNSKGCFLLRGKKDLFLLPEGGHNDFGEGERASTLISKNRGLGLFTSKITSLPRGEKGGRVLTAGGLYIRRKRGYLSRPIKKPNPKGEKRSSTSAERLFLLEKGKNPRSQTGQLNIKTGDITGRRSTPPKEQQGASTQSGK